MNFHQELVVYYIFDYFGMLFILDINSVLKEFILRDQRLSVLDCITSSYHDNYLF